MAASMYAFLGFFQAAEIASPSILLKAEVCGFDLTLAQRT